MNTPITITEIIGRSDRGMTRPFICTADFAIYYVKGAYAGKNSLCREWVANRLVNPDGDESLPVQLNEERVSSDQ